MAAVVTEALGDSVDFIVVFCVALIVGEAVGDAVPSSLKVSSAIKPVLSSS